MNCKKVLTFAALAVFTLSNASAQSVQPKASGGVNLGSGQLTAAVLGNGTLVDTMSKGVLPCTGTGGKCLFVTGVYDIQFARDVTRCTTTATITFDTPASGSITPATIAAGQYGPANQVRVYTWGHHQQFQSYELSNRSFQLLVSC
jgi:hypothetical protein